MPLIHHELCFGCGRQNLFGLLAELEHAGAGTVAGRQAPAEIELRFAGTAAVGEFVELEASGAKATARVSGRTLATARASYG